MPPMTAPQMFHLLKQVWRAMQSIALLTKPQAERKQGLSDFCLSAAKKMANYHKRKNYNLSHRCTCTCFVQRCVAFTCKGDTSFLHLGQKNIVPQSATAYQPYCKKKDQMHHSSWGADTAIHCSSAAVAVSCCNTPQTCRLDLVRKSSCKRAHYNFLLVQGHHG